jgi:anti-anti-sigma regulatory factor
MMKIQVRDVDGQVILEIEGRLTGAFVPELEACWQSARSTKPDRPLSVDLKNVTCVDRAGRALLQRMHSEHVPFLRAGLAIRDILEEIGEETKCRS